MATLGVEPAAHDYARELERLHAKVEAGAELIMTQPVYDERLLDRLLSDIAPLGVPVLVGLLPLASHKNAEFLHNEVPGMQVPEEVRERMRKAGSGPAARKEGVAIARGMVKEPTVLLADEPTGNLDSESSAKVVRLFRDIGERHRTTIVMVTHSREVASAAHRIVEMRDGRVVS